MGVRIATDKIAGDVERRSPDTRYHHHLVPNIFVNFVLDAHGDANGRVTSLPEPLYALPYGDPELR